MKATAYRISFLSQEAEKSDSLPEPSSRQTRKKRSASQSDSSSGAEALSHARVGSPEAKIRCLVEKVHRQEEKMHHHERRIHHYEKKMYHERVKLRLEKLKVSNFISSPHDPPAPFDWFLLLADEVCVASSTK